MQTPPTTPQLPHRPAAPAPKLMSTRCDPLMPGLNLPDAITNTQNVLLPVTSLNLPSSIPHVQQPQPVNPMRTLATRNQHFHMTVAFNFRELATQLRSTRRNVQPECIPAPNTTQDSASPLQSPATYATFSVVQAHELPIIDFSPSQADQ